MATSNRWGIIKEYIYQSLLIISIIGFQAFFALCLLLQVSILPDSPRWCMAHGRDEEGTRIIAMLEGRDSLDDPHILAKKKEIQVSLEQESLGGTFTYCIDSSHIDVCTCTRPLQVW